VSVLQNYSKRGGPEETYGKEGSTNLFDMSQLNTGKREFIYYVTK
jgi:hypothetical protein